MSKKNEQNIFGGGTPKATLNFTPHAGQAEVRKAIRDAVQAAPDGAEPAVFTIVGSRGWGKTIWLVTQVMMPYVYITPNAKIMWVGPNYSTAMAFVEDVLRGINEDTGERWVPEYDADGNRVWEFILNTPTGPQVRFYNGATVTIKSADSPDSIVGRGYNLIILDEAGMIDERVFEQQILGTARKRDIKIFAITSPRGKRHWTYRYYMLGQDPNEPLYMSFQQPWWKNPKYPPFLIEAMKKVPDHVRRQEYEAEFLDEGDTIFKGLFKVLDGEEIRFENNDQEWDPGALTDITVGEGDQTALIKANARRFVCGLDVAKSQDFTVFYVMDLDTGKCVYYRRFNLIGYDIILSMAEKICARFNGAELVYDGTGVGSGLGDFFQKHDVSTHPFVFTNDSKAELVTTLAVSIEQGQIRIPNITTIVNELSMFSYEITRAGRLTYSAPQGQHDDVVMALGLANWYRHKFAGDQTIHSIESFLSLNNRGPRTFNDFMESDND